MLASSKLQIPSQWASPKIQQTAAAIVEQTQTSSKLQTPSCWVNPHIWQISGTLSLSRPRHLSDLSKMPSCWTNQKSSKLHIRYTHWATRHAAVLRCLALVEAVDTKQISDAQQISGTLLIQETQTPSKPQTPCWVRKLRHPKNLRHLADSGNSDTQKTSDTLLSQETRHPENLRHLAESGNQTPRKPQTTTCWVDADTQSLLHTIWENQTRLYSANPPNKTWTPSCWADTEETQTPNKPQPPLAEQTQTPNKSRMPFEEQTRQLANPRETSCYPCLGDQQTPGSG